jgi:hypothetical protein
MRTPNVLCQLGAHTTWIDAAGSCMCEGVQDCHTDGRRVVSGCASYHVAWPTKISRTPMVTLAQTCCCRCCRCCHSHVSESNGLGGLPLFMCPHVIIIQACVSRPQTAPPSQGAGPMGGILWRYGAKGGPYGLLLLLLCCSKLGQLRAAHLVHLPFG